MVWIAVSMSSISVSISLLYSCEGKEINDPLLDLFLSKEQVFFMEVRPFRHTGASKKVFNLFTICS